MRRERHQIHCQFSQVNADLACPLSGVDMEQRAVFTNPLADQANIVERAQFVIDHHQRDQKRIVAQRTEYRFDADQAVGVRRQIRDLDAFFLQLRCSIENGLVFDLAGDDVAFRTLMTLGIAVGHAFERQVVGFRSPGSPDDLLGLSPYEVGNLLARDVHCGPSLTAIAVGTGRRVAERTGAAQALHHDFNDTLINWCGSRVVKIQRKIFH